MRTLVALTFATVIALALGLATYLGAFKSVQIAEQKAGPFKVVSKPHIGAYHKIVPVMEEVEKWARENDEPCRLSFGEYLDDVNTVAEDRLRSNAGCLVEKEWTDGLPQDFTYRVIPERHYVVAEFDGAPSIGPLKVYPKAFEFIQENDLRLDGAVIEMYEILPEQKVKTRYYFPVLANSSSAAESQ